MSDYINNQWLDILQHNNLADFERIWQLEIGWFEEPNKRRGGWSGVSQMTVTANDGQPRTLFVKRQQNHPTRTFCHPLRGIQTLKREFDNIQKYRQYGIPTATPIFFGERMQNRERQAILILEGLGGFTSLDGYLRQWQQQGFPSQQDQQQIMAALARQVLAIHQNHLSYNCLYPKHILLKIPERSPLTATQIEVAFIDLEKSRFRFSKRRAAIRDLDTLNRNTHGLSQTQRLRFLKIYLGEQRLNHYRNFVKALNKRFRRKKHRNQAK